MALTRRAIRVYAALSGLKDHRDEDVLDALIPFLMPILQLMKGSQFISGHIVLGVKKLYGWEITLPVAEAFRERLRSKGYLVSVLGPDRKSTLVCQPPPDPPVDPEEVEVSTAIDAIMDDFERFPATVSNLFHAGRSRAELTDVLIRFLVSLDAYSEDAMKRGLRDLKVDLEPNSPLAQLEDDGEPLSPEDRYVCAKFVKHLASTSSSHLQHLSKIVAVGLLTEVIVDFVKPAGVVKNSNLTVVLDAPLALDLLGTAGPAIQTDAQNVVKSLRGIGCKFVVLKTSCDEMARVLKTMMSMPVHNRHGVTHSAMLRGEVTDDFVRYIIADPEGALNQIDVPARHMSLDDYPNMHRHFSEERFEQFMAGINWSNSNEAREHDARCMALTMRLRGGAHQRDPLACNYVFVTSNARFSRYARDYCLRENMINERYCGPVIHQRDLATAAWLRTGFAGSDVPRGHLIAACERVLKVRKEVVRRAQQVVQDVRPERMQQLELLLRDSRSVARLMDYAMGTEGHIDDKNAEGLLDDMLRATMRQLEQKHMVEIRERDSQAAALKAAHATNLAMRDAALARKDNVIASQAARIDALEAEYTRRVTQRWKLISEAAASVNRNARYFERLLTGLLYVAAALAFGHTLASEFNLIPAVAPFKWAAAPLAAITVYHFVMDVRQRPKRGFDDLCNLYVAFAFRRRLMKVGVHDATMDSVTIASGRVSVHDEPNKALLQRTGRTLNLEGDAARVSSAASKRMSPPQIKQVRRGRARRRGE